MPDLKNLPIESSKLIDFLLDYIVENDERDCPNSTYCGKTWAGCPNYPKAATLFGYELDHVELYFCLHNIPQEQRKECFLQWAIEAVSAKQTYFCKKVKNT